MGEICTINIYAKGNCSMSSRNQRTKLMLSTLKENFVWLRYIILYSKNRWSSDFSLNVILCHVAPQGIWIALSVPRIDLTTVKRYFILCYVRTIDYYRCYLVLPPFLNEDFVLAKLPIYDKMKVTIFEINIAIDRIDIISGGAMVAQFIECWTPRFKAILKSFIWDIVSAPFIILCLLEKLRWLWLLQLNIYLTISDIVCTVMIYMIVYNIPVNKVCFLVV